MYRERIEKLAPGYDPAHVEANMRVLRPVLDALSDDDFRWTLGAACKAIETMGLDWSDHIAEMYGLRPKKRAS